MGNETWFRGEGVGVAPNPAGKNLLDYGDGLYLSDKEDVALQYAKLRAPGDKSWQVLQATIDRQSLGRVLDLTTDPRWQKFMSRPMYPGTNNANLNRSRLEYVRMKNELYGQFFKEFQQAHNIDIKDFDAVVGPEYVRGGKQLCILEQGRFPNASERARIRALFRPRMAQGGFTVKPMLSNWPRVIGGFLEVTGIGLLIAFVAQKIMNRINDDIIRKAMESFGPSWKSSRPKCSYVVDRLANGEGAFVSAYIEVAFGMYPNQDWQIRLHRRSAAGAYRLSDGLPEGSEQCPGQAHQGQSRDLERRRVAGPLLLLDLRQTADREGRSRTVQGFPGTAEMVRGHGKSEHRHSDRTWIEKERTRLKQWRDDAYPSANYRPNRALWTEDGYDGMMRLGWGGEPAKI